MEFPLVVAPYSSAIPGIGGDDCVNQRTDVAGPGALAQRVIVPTPALRVFVPQVGTGATRGMYRAAGGRVFQVAGSTLYEIQSNGTRTTRGTVGSTSGSVAMSDNGNHLILVDGDSGYTLDLVTNAFTEIADPEFPAGCTQVAFIDGYFLAIEPGTLHIRWSELLDGTLWPVLNRAAAYASPDEVTAIVACGRELWALGPYSTQVFYDSGNPDQQFEPVQSVAIDIGIAAPHSLAVARDSVLFVGASKDGAGRVYRSSGYSLSIVSAPGIEGIIAAAGDVSDAIGWVHSEAGRTFYVVTLPTAEKTLVYDVDLNEWHERAWMNPDTGALLRWRATWTCHAFGKTLMGDSDSDAVYYLSESHYKDEKPNKSGEWWIKRRRTMPQLTAGGKMVQHLDFEAWGRFGEGMVTGYGTDPVMIVSWSNDGGRSFGSTQHLTMGHLGDYGHRVRLPMAGQARSRVYRLEITDPIPYALAGARGEIVVLDR